MSDASQIMIQILDREDLAFIENENGQYIHTSEVEKVNEAFLELVKEKNLEIAELKKEKLRLKTRENYCHIPQLHEQELELKAKDAEIAELKKQVEKLKDAVKIWHESTQSAVARHILKEIGEMNE